MSIEDLLLREAEKLYPPRFVVVARSSTAKDCHVVFTFEGATEEIVKEITLQKGISCY